MRARSAVALVCLVLAAVFLLLNWRLFAGSAHVNFLLTSMDAPLGLVMLVLFGLLLGVLALSMGLWQSTLLGEFRRQAKELEVQRTLAESAEASRFTELGRLIRDEIAGLRTELEHTENSLAATLGEMDDRLRSRAPGVENR